MKRSIRYFAAALAAVTAMTCTALTASADKLTTVDGVKYRYSDSGERIGTYTGFTKNKTGRRYYRDGIAVKNKWLKTKSGKRYYAGSDGYFATGWKKFKSGWHWFKDNGAEATGKVSVLGVPYYFNKSGVLDSTYSETYRAVIDAVRGAMPEIYGNAGYTDGFELTVLATDPEKAKSLMPRVAPVIRIRKCKYSMAQLEQTAKAIEDNRSAIPSGFDITIDAEKNIVEIAIDCHPLKLYELIDSLEYGGCVVINYLVLSDDEWSSAGSMNRVADAYNDYFVHNGIYYVNVTDDSSWGSYTFTKGALVGAVTSVTTERVVADIPELAASKLPAGTNIYCSNENKMILLAEYGGRLLPYVEMVEG